MTHKRNSAEGHNPPPPPKLVHPAAGVAEPQTDTAWHAPPPLQPDAPVSPADPVDPVEQNAEPPVAPPAPVRPPPAGKKTSAVYNSMTEVPAGSTGWAVNVVVLMVNRGQMIARDVNHHHLIVTLDGKYRPPAVFSRVLVGSHTPPVEYVQSVAHAWEVNGAFTGPANALAFCPSIPIVPTNAHDAVASAVACPDGDTCDVAGVLERVEAPVMRHAAQHQFASQGVTVRFGPAPTDHMRITLSGTLLGVVSSRDVGHKIILFSVHPQRGFFNSVKGTAVCIDPDVSKFPGFEEYVASFSDHARVGAQSVDTVDY